MKKAWFNEQSRRCHDYETNRIIAKRLIESGEYELVAPPPTAGNPKKVKNHKTPRRKYRPAGDPPKLLEQANTNEPMTVHPQPEAQPATQFPEAEAADVITPTFSEADEWQRPAAPAEPEAKSQAEPPETPSEFVPGDSHLCPHCGTLPRVCPEGHKYYEGSTEEECAELVDMWVSSIQAFAQATRGSEPIPISPKLRTRFAKVLEKHSRRYPPMPGKVEIPLLLLATASSCTRPGEQQSEGVENHTGEEPQPTNEGNGSSRPGRGRGGLGVAL